MKLRNEPVEPVFTVEGHDVTIDRSIRDMEHHDFQVRLGGYALNTSTGNFRGIRFDHVRDEGRSS